MAPRAVTASTIGPVALFSGTAISTSGRIATSPKLGPSAAIRPKASAARPAQAMATRLLSPSASAMMPAAGLMKTRRNIADASTRLICEASSPCPVSQSGKNGR